PLPPPGRALPHAAASAPAGGRRPDALRALSEPGVRRLRHSAQDAHRRRARGAPGLRVAGQRTRARQPDGASRAALVRVPGARRRPRSAGPRIGVDGRRRVGELARRRRTRSSRRRPSADELEHLENGRAPRDLAQHPARAYREVRTPPGGDPCSVDTDAAAPPRAAPSADAPSRAAHAAMAIVKAVERAKHETGAGPAIRVAVHTSQFLVGQGAAAAELDVEGKQAALTILDALIARAEPDGVVISET